tara:strand:+ start:20 stop:640 length:621 start_codon:yes stop_codon:yes gene_type:complete
MSFATRPIRQQGVGLIEVLITLFILAVGLLGVASLQFVGSFANKDAVSRTQSELVAQQVAERLRSAARPPAVGDGLVVHDRYFNEANYNFDGLDCDDDQPYLCHCLSLPASIPDCEGDDCNEEEISQYDGWALSCAAVQTNPLTRLNVSCTDNNAGDGDACSAGSRVEIMLTWPLSTSANRQSTLNTRCNPGEGDSFACVIKDITL